MFGLRQSASNQADATMLAAEETYQRMAHGIIVTPFAASTATTELALDHPEKVSPKKSRVQEFNRQDEHRTGFGSSQGKPRMKSLRDPSAAFYSSIDRRAKSRPEKMHHDAGRGNSSARSCKDKFYSVQASPMAILAKRTVARSYAGWRMSQRPSNSPGGEGQTSLADRRRTI